MLDLTAVSVAIPSSGEALGPLTYHLRDGRWLGILGPSGSGKSGLAEVIAGLRAPTAGTRTISTEHARDLLRAGRGVRYVPGADPFPPALRVGELLADRARLRAYTAPEVRELLGKAAAEWGLRPHMRTKVGRLPRHIRRRVALADAFMGTPRLVVLDDPFWGCHDGHVRALRERIAPYRAKGVALVMASRTPVELAGLALDILELGRGGQVVHGGDWSSWRKQRLRPGFFRLVAKGPGGAVEEALRKVAGVHRVLWHEGGAYNTFELRLDSAPRVREAIFGLFAAHGWPIVELTPEDPPADYSGEITALISRTQAGAGPRAGTRRDVPNAPARPRLGVASAPSRSHSPGASDSEQAQVPRPRKPQATLAGPPGRAAQGDRVTPADGSAAAPADHRQGPS